jgi:hypothetical protein
MGSGVARQCSGNRCLARRTVLDPPSWPPRRSRSSELEERPAYGPESGFLCPSRPTDQDRAATFLQADSVEAG